MGSDLYRITTVVTRVVADNGAGADGRFIADLDVFAENRARADGCVLADLGGGGNDGRRMNGATAVGVAEQASGSGEGKARLRGNEDRLGGLATGGKVSRDYG